MPEEPPDPILIQVTVPLPIPMIYAALLEPEKLAGWLCRSAVVEPKKGGRYELAFEQETKFVSRGQILTMTPDLDLGFSWTGPDQFAAFMNTSPPSTHVYLRLAESPEGIDVTLEHSGWGLGDAWAEARSWHFHLWDDRLREFKDYLIRAAYG